MSINAIKYNNIPTLENLKNKHYSKRANLSSFSYVAPKKNTEPCFMLFGGLHGGLQFFGGNWI